MTTNAETPRAESGAFQEDHTAGGSEPIVAQPRLRRVGTCPTCGRHTASPDDRIENGAFYCGDCDMLRIPAPGSDLDRETRTMYDFLAFIEDFENCPRPKFRVITGEAR